MQFDDGKAPDALRTIGEVAKALGIRQHVLRYWEDQFPMLRPVKRSGGRRYYRPDDIQLVATIDRLVHREGYTLKGACKALTGSAGRAQLAIPATGQPAPNGEAQPAGEDATPQLRAIRNRLASALEAT